MIFWRIKSLEGPNHSLLRQITQFNTPIPFKSSAYPRSKRLLAHLEPYLKPNKQSQIHASS